MTADESCERRDVTVDRLRFGLFHSLTILFLRRFQSWSTYRGWLVLATVVGVLIGFNTGAQEYIERSISIVMREVSACRCLFLRWVGG